MKQILNEERKDETIINFRANPKPTDCQWTIFVENVKNQTYEPCEISQHGGINGDYFVNLNATPQDPIILFVTDEFGTSKFQRYSAEMEPNF